MTSVSTVWVFPSGPTGFRAVWGTPRDASADHQDLVSAVWYAEYDGRAWSAPELVLKARTIDWWHGIATVAIEGNKIIVAAPASDSGWSGVAASLKTRSGWIQNRFRMKGGLSPAGVAAVFSRGAPVLFYRDDTSQGSTTSSALFSRAMSADGRQWRAERVIRNLRPGALNWPLALRDSAGRMHLFWLFKEDGQTGDDLEHAWQARAGTWRFDRKVVGARVFDVDIIAAPSTIHVALQTALFEGVAVTRWTPSGFSRVEELPFAHAIGTGPNLFLVRGGAIGMSWTSASTFLLQDRTITYPATLFAVLRSSCS